MHIRGAPGPWPTIQGPWACAAHPPFHPRVLSPCPCQAWPRGPSRPGHALPPSRGGDDPAEGHRRGLITENPRKSPPHPETSAEPGWSGQRSHPSGRAGPTATTTGALASPPRAPGFPAQATEESSSCPCPVGLAPAVFALNQAKGPWGQHLLFRGRGGPGPAVVRAPCVPSGANMALWEGSEQKRGWGVQGRPTWPCRPCRGGLRAHPGAPRRERQAPEG